MVPFRFCLLLMLLLAGVITGHSQVTLTASSGIDTGSFTTLKEAFDAINAGTHQGNIIININASTTETATAVLYASGMGSSSYTGISIYPTAVGLSITGNMATPLIDLNGGDNVVIDGRVNATGTEKSLTISNASTSNSAETCTIRFANDATSNTIRYCRLKGSTMSAGILYFGTTTGSTGNDNNTIERNDITCADDANRPVCAIYATGTSSKANNGNNISNNNFYNFLNRGTASYGISIQTNNNAYSITDNSFYETATFTATASVSYYAIYVNGSTPDHGFTISGNYIGGSEPLCGGNAWTKTAQSNAFTGIYVKSNSGPVTNIQGNIMRNINWANLGTTGTAPLTGIQLAGSMSANVGTVTGNIIGAASGNGSITINGGTVARIIYGIYITSTGTTDCRNNIIGSITASHNDPTQNFTFYGIFKSGAGATTISGNTIGSSTTARSINITSASTSVAQKVYGISSTPSSSTVTIADNTVANIVNGTTNSTAGATGQIVGISANAGTHNVTGNIVRDLTIANANTNAISSASVIGISFPGPVSTAQTIIGNTIYNLSNTYDSFAGSVHGIYFAGSNSAASMISRNFIHSLSVDGMFSTAAKIYGIRIYAGNTTYSNNIISLSVSSQTDICGIFEPGSANNNNKLYFNTVYLSGSLPSGSTNVSYGIYCAGTTSVRDFRNNVLVNARSTPDAANKHYAIYVVTAGGTFTCNYNNYYVSGTGGVLGYYGAEVTSLPIVTGVTGNDSTSIATNPAFSGTGTTAADYLPTVPGTGVSGTGILIDYLGNYRSSSPIMGALSPACLHPTNGGTIASAQYGIAPFDPAALISSVDASGQTGTIEYKWQSSTTSSSADFIDISGSNAAGYDPGELTQTTWFRRLARVDCAADWTGAAVSNVIEVTLGSSVTWNGSVSTDWNTAANWTPAIVPTSNLDVIIPVSAANTPVPPATATITQLNIENGKTLELGSGNLTLTGNLTNNGSITATSGKLSLAGSVAQTISGTGSISSVEINNATGVTITSGVGNMQTITGMLMPTSGTLTTNGNLTLKSDASGTARVGAGAASGGYIIGDVVTQRHLTKLTGEGRNGRAWRLVSVPTEGTGTLRDYFMGGRPGADLTDPANRSLEPDALGTVVIGHNQPDAATATGAGYDWIGVANQVSSLRYFQPSTGSGSFASSQVPLLTTMLSAADQGYMIFARGDRQQQYNGTGNASTTTLQVTGSLKQGTKSVTIPALADAGYVLVGNPYMSVIDMEQVYIDNADIIEPIVYVWDANTDGNAYKQGGYRTITRTGPGAWTITGGATNPQYIESHTAFFVRPTAAGGTLQIKESHKVNGTPGIAPHGSAANSLSKIFVNLEVTDTANRRLVDGAVVFFDASYKDGMGDALDIMSMSNITAGAVGLKQSGMRLSMEARPWPADSLQRSIPLDMRNLGNDSYILRLMGESMKKEGFRVWMRDRHLNTETELKLDEATLYPFRRTGDVGIDSGRFEIIYRMAKTSTSGTLTPDDVTETPSVKLYPNPARASDIRLSLRAITPGTYTIQVLDLSGRLVAVKSIEHGSSSGEYPVIAGLQLSRGQYILRLMDADKQLKETLWMMVE